MRVPIVLENREGKHPIPSERDRQLLRRLALAGPEEVRKRVLLVLGRTGRSWVEGERLQTAVLGEAFFQPRTPIEEAYAIVTEMHFQKAMDELISITHEVQLFSCPR